MISAATYCLGVPRNGADDRPWRRGEGVFYHLTKTVGGEYFPTLGVCCDTTSTIPLLTCVSSFRVSFSHRPVGICRMQWSSSSVPGVSIRSPPHVVQIIDNRSSTMNRKVYNVAKNQYHGVVFLFGPRGKQWVLVWSWRFSFRSFLNCFYQFLYFNR